MKYHRPDSLSSYSALAEELVATRTAILAGGTDLIPGYENGRILPDHLIDIKALPELATISDNKRQTEIGALIQAAVDRKPAAGPATTNARVAGAAMAMIGG